MAERDRPEDPQDPRRAGVRCRTPAPSASAASARPVEFVIQTSGTYEQLQEYADELLERLQEYPGLESVDTDLKLNTPEFRIEIDRAKVADLGIDVTVVGRTLETLLGGRQVTRFEMNGEQYDVIVQLAAEDRATPATLSTIFLRAPRGEMVQLSNIVSVKESVAPKELKRFNQLRAVTISANLAPGYALGEALDVPREDGARGAARRPCRPTSTARAASSAPRGRASPWCSCWRWSSSTSCWRRSSRASAIPLIIMLTVPLSMTGALGALYFAGGTLNVYSQIGLVTLVGLITKHGILIVEFANQQQEQGKERARRRRSRRRRCGCARS